MVTRARRRLSGLLARWAVRINPDSPLKFTTRTPGGFRSAEMARLGRLAGEMGLSTSADHFDHVRVYQKEAADVSEPQYAVLAQAISEVANGQIGGKLGLGLSGLRKPDDDDPGTVARY